MLLLPLTLVGGAVLSLSVDAKPADPCVAIGGQKWVAPSQVRACFDSFPLNETIRNNILDVVNKTFSFQTSVNFQISAPEPFTQDVHVDIAAELSRIRKQHYRSDFAFHVDLSRTIKRLQDGHTVYVGLCYDSLFVSFIPFPVVLLNDGDKQQVHIAPEAFNVSSVEFADEISFWENEAHLDLKKFSGAAVLEIDGSDPWKAINANAAITGSFQALTTRQNKFFSSYVVANVGYSYRMGDFAQKSLPLTDSVTMTVLPVGSKHPEKIKVPYRSRFSAASVPFTDGPSLQVGNCIAQPFTNGIDIHAPPPGALSQPTSKGQSGRFRFEEFLTDRKHARNAIINDAPLSDVALPPELTPSQSVGGSGAIQFYELEDGKTGVLSLGSFSTDDFDVMETTLLTGLQALKSNGKTHLVVDLTNNGGGFICIAHWLHRIIVGPNSHSAPQAGLDTESRAQPIAQMIVSQINNGADPDDFLFYNPVNWRDANGNPFSIDTNWLAPPVQQTVNGHPDAFSQRLGQECQPFDQDPPEEQLFAPENIALVTNGLCASSCALFTIALNKHYNVTTVVVAGKQGTTQQYTGTVGGQSASFADMDTEVKTTHLKNSSLAPPDFLTNSVQGITWRLGFGIDDPTKPEEWQSHPATINFPLTASTVNNPRAIWNAVAARVFP